MPHPLRESNRNLLGGFRFSLLYKKVLFLLAQLPTPKIPLRPPTLVVQ